MKQIRLYNVIFPLWLLIMFPVPALATLLCVVGNGLIDGAVLHYGAKRQQVQMERSVFIKTWLKVFVTGWSMDFLMWVDFLLCAVL